MQTYIPYATSIAGLCLTGLNWQEVGIKTLAFELDIMLIKPGLAFIKHHQTLAKVMVFEGEAILDASALKPNRLGEFHLQSPFDGSRIKLSQEALFDCIARLAPQAVILPKGLYGLDTQVLQHSAIIPHFTEAATYPEALELWREADEVISPKSLVICSKEDASLSRLVSDVAAAHAYAGVVDAGQDELNLTDLRFAQDFALIEAACGCPTCQQGYTRAYLHHLYLNTPLLCQRFLIQHNLYRHLRQA